MSRTDLNMISVGAPSFHEMHEQIKVVRFNTDVRAAAADGSVGL